jgi:hypothetical protein
MEVVEGEAVVVDQAPGEAGGRGHVLFVCQDELHLRRFLDGADHQVTGHHVHPSQLAHDHTYPGRRRLPFVCEADIHRGDRRAFRLPRYPPGHPNPAPDALEPERLDLPGPSEPASATRDGELAALGLGTAASTREFHRLEAGGRRFKSSRPD